MKHFGLDLKVAFKHQIMQQSVEFVCGCCVVTYLTAKSLFVLIPSHFLSYVYSRFLLSFFFLCSSVIPLPTEPTSIDRG